MTAPIIDAPPLPPSDPMLDDTFLRVNKLLKDFDVPSFAAGPTGFQTLDGTNVAVGTAQEMLHVRIPEMSAWFLYYLCGYGADGKRLAQCERGDDGWYRVPLRSDSGEPIMRVCLVPVELLLIREVRQIGHWGWLPRGFVRLWDARPGNDGYTASAGIEPSAPLRSEGGTRNYPYFAVLRQTGWEVTYPQHEAIMGRNPGIVPLVSARVIFGDTAALPGFRPRS